MSRINFEKISITLSATCSGVDLYYYKYANRVFATNNLCYSPALCLDQVVKYCDIP